MNFETVLLFFAFIVPIVFTPGPVNVVLAATAARYGIRPLLPFFLGLWTANMLFSVLAALILGQLYRQYPQAHVFLHYAGIAYMFYLSYKILSSHPDLEQKEKLFGFKEGILLVGLNPKAHSVFVIMFTQFTSPDEFVVSEVAMLIGLLYLVVIPSNFFWAGLGILMGKLSSSRKALELQNRILGITLALTALYMALG